MDFWASFVSGNYGSLQLSWVDICLRLLCAMLVGMVIGIEREYTHRPAGMRTHILVSLGACAVMITGQLIFAQYREYGSTADPARLAAQVIAGVGFLGAGTIMREGVNVKGLTTAASVWCVACLGIAAGGGYYAVALIGMVFIFITLTVFELLQNLLISPHSNVREYAVDAVDVVEALSSINTNAQLQKCEIRNLHVETACADTYRITFRAEFGRGKAKKRRQKYFEGLAMTAAIRSVHVIDETVGAK